MGFNEWAAGFGLALTALVGWLGAVHKRVNWLAGKVDNVVPRAEIDGRFGSIDRRHHQELSRVERRVDSHYEKMDGKLDKIIDRLDRKADKE